ncbi:MAG: glycoside hydrolase family 57 [Thiohalocapsa sp.]
MTASNVFHALGLHMHQPPGNLQLLIDANPWEAEQIIRCYERPARYARQYADVGHLHIGFSGILLEQLRDPGIVDRYRHVIDIPAMLDAYRDTDNVELIGMGYFHPIFPLIPIADWEEQLRTGRELMQEVFGRAPRGFWPPEMAFSMEMIPALVKAGYEYVVVDGVHVHPQDGVNDVFRPYLACYEGSCITVVPRDRDVSNAQESGLDATWFANEVTHRCRFSARPDEHRLVTTWSDGENGGWFRQMHEGSGFFGHYFSPYMEHVRGGEYPVTPVGISDYLRDHPPSVDAQVQTGAWNVGSTSGFDLSQWAGSGAQQAAAEGVRELSRRWWSLAGLADGPTDRLDPTQRSRLAEVRRLVLESETSCYLFWGDDWLPKLYAITDTAGALMEELEAEQRAADVPANKNNPRTPRS